MIKKIKLKGARNTRLVPAFETTEGKRVKEGAFIRSGKLNKVPKKKLYNFLDEYNVKKIIDFRTDVEVHEAGSITYPSDVEYQHLPLLNKAFFGVTHEKKMSKILYKESKKMKLEDIEPGYMTDMYKSIVFDPYSQSKFKEFFDVILNNEDGGSILYHCNGGKDRTGITTLFILTLLGVSEEDILKDFAMSDYFNRHYNRSRKFLMLLLFPVPKFVRILTSMLHAKRIYLENMIAAINEKYGSVLNYLKEAIHIDEEKQNKLKLLYLE